MSKLEQLAQRLNQIGWRLRTFALEGYRSEYCDEAAAALRECETVLHSVLEGGVNGEHSSSSGKQENIGRREWWRGGLWLYPGSRLVYLDREDCEKIRALLKVTGRE